MSENSIKAQNCQLFIVLIFSVGKVKMKIPTNKKKTLTKDPRLIFISKGNKLSPLRINGGRQSYRTEWICRKFIFSVASANYRGRWCYSVKTPPPPQFFFTLPGLIVPKHEFIGKVGRVFSLIRTVDVSFDLRVPVFGMPFRHHPLTRGWNAFGPIRRMASFGRGAPPISAKMIVLNNFCFFLDVVKSCTTTS